MKKKTKNLIIIIVALVLVVLGLFTHYVDMGRVATNNEPKYCIKIVTNGGNKVTYWGLGYKVVRYPAVSPNEPYKNNLGAKMGSWFMVYKLAEYDEINVEILTEGECVKITRIRDIEAVVNLLEDARYTEEICDGINTHKIELGKDTYYIKEGCKEIQKGRKQAKITDKDFENLMNIINDYYIYNEYDKTYTLDSNKVDTEKLVKYNGNLYGKSYAVIDYAPNPNGPIGIIDKLIDEAYIPKYDGETNVKEILNAKVDSMGKESMVLYYNNEYVLFEKIDN